AVAFHDESQPRLRRHWHDQSGRSQMRARSGNRLRDDGDGDRLRLLESGRGACHCGNRDREPATKRRSSKGNHSACAAAGPGRTRMLLSSRAGKRRFDRQKTLAREDEDGAATAASKISVAHFSATLLQNERPRKETGKTTQIGQSGAVKSRINNRP